MATKLEAINITCRDHVATAALWSKVLGLIPFADMDPNDPDDYLMYRIPDTDVFFAFQPPDNGEVGDAFVPRIHLDAFAVGNTRDEEVEKLAAEGLTVTADRRNPDGSGWVTLTDADGTDICIGRSDEERGGPPA